MADCQCQKCTWTAPQQAQEPESFLDVLWRNPRIADIIQRIARDLDDLPEETRRKWLQKDGPNG